MPCSHTKLCKLIQADGDYTRFDYCKECDKQFECLHFKQPKLVIKYGKDRFKAAVKSVDEDFITFDHEYDWASFSDD